MSEEELIEALSERNTRWRDHWDDPFEAAEHYGIDIESPDSYSDLSFDD